MDQARSGRYYAEDFDDKPKHPRVLVCILVVAAMLSHFAAIKFGMWIEREEQARQRAIEASKPKPVHIRPAIGLTQWSCTKQEMREYVHACARRKRQEEIFGP